MKDEDKMTAVLFAALRGFLIPGGEDAARPVRCVRLKEEGEIRSSADARWIPFTADERIDAQRSGFLWEARFRTARILPMVVVDAYEERHGRLVVRLGGALPVVNSRGPDSDKGELQRYLSSAMMCPPLLVANRDLVWSAIDGRTLRVRDAGDTAGTAVDYGIGEDGLPLICRADRPRTVGKKTILTPWSAKGGEFRTYQGLRIAAHLEAAWHLPEGAFTYFRCDVVSISIDAGDPDGRSRR